MNTATPQDTQDHILGSGALGYEWWHAVTETGMDTPDWSAVITADDGDDGEAIATVNHSAVMKAARAIMKDKPKYASDALVRECRNLVFDADNADFDANSADELLQFIVLGEIVFG
jgi:hypothetical protein